MVDFVAKPVDPQTLCSVIPNWRHEPAALADEAQNAHTSPAAQQHCAQASLQALAASPLIDVDYALENPGGKAVLLLRLLKPFVLSNGSALNTVKAHLQKGDRVSARRVAHPLEGSAATPGMRVLSVRTAYPRASLIDGDDGGELDTLVGDLERRLQDVIATLQPISI